MQRTVGTLHATAFEYSDWLYFLRHAKNTRTCSIPQFSSRCYTELAPRIYCTFDVFNDFSVIICICHTSLLLVDISASWFLHGTVE